MKALTLILVAISVALSGCLGGGGGSSSSAGPSAEVRVLHAAADAPAVDIYINGDLAIEDLDTFTATAFTRVPAEPLTIDVRAAGAAADSEPVFSTEVTPVRGEDYTLVAYGLLGDDSFDLLVITDDIQTPAAATARAFVLHAAPQVGNVDVYVDTTDALGDTPLLADFAPAADSGAYVEVPAGEYRIRITPAGDPATIAYDSGFVELESGPSYFLAAIPRASGFSPASVIALLDSPPFVVLEDQRAQVRALHLSPDAPAVDVTVDGDVVLSDVSFKDVSDYLQVLAGDYTIGVEAGGNEVASLPVTVEAGQAYSVLATGFVNVTGVQGFTLRPLVDDLTPAAGAKIRVIHASPDAPAVDVLVNGDIFAGLADVPYFTASDYVEVPAGSYDISINVADTTTTVIDLPTTALAAGSIYTAIAVNEVASIEPLLVVDP